MRKRYPLSPTLKEIEEMNRLHKEKGFDFTSLSRRFGYHPSTISKYVTRISVSEMPLEVQQTKINYETKVWTSDETEYLLDSYKFTTNLDMAYALGKTKNQVVSRLAFLRSKGLVGEARRGRPRKEI